MSSVSGLRTKKAATMANIEITAPQMNAVWMPSAVAATWSTPLAARRPAVIDITATKRAVPAAPMPGDESLASTLPAGRLRERLYALRPDLTTREADVCVRLLQGMTHDGIAADLGVSLTTVKTYRNRAFDRLGIHFRNELFARVLGAA